MAAEPLAVARTYQPAIARRQGGIPQFLDKLYHMVEDPNTDLIKWSDTGDSFVVTDQERFSKEILGRWFKHQNFGSFVRQLNLYGFRKVPHLQQGALHSDTSQEPLCFENTNFQRGQPDLLHLITRKKQAAPGKEDGNEGTTGTNNPAARTLTSSNGALDVGGVLSGIAAIKRHQTQISNELTELKRSNQALWQEAITSRERYQRQQDTIDRILKFLAGVFGNAPGANTQNKDVPAQSTPSSSLRNLHPQRLMIKAKAPDASESRFVDHSDDLSNREDDIELDGDNTPPPEKMQFATISSVTSPSATTPFSNDLRSGKDVDPLSTFTLGDIMHTETASVADSHSNGNGVHTSFVSSPHTSLVPANTSGHSEPVLENNLLTALMKDPVNFQRVLSALSAISPGAIPTNGSVVHGSDLALVQSLPSPPSLSLDPAPYGSSPADLQQVATNNASLSLLSSADTVHEQQIQNQADTTDRLASHFESMDATLQSLLDSFGIQESTPGAMAYDPTVLDHDLLGSSVGAGEPIGIDWDTILHHTDGELGVPVEDDYNALDSDTITASPASAAPALPLLSVEAQVPAKRKSDVVEPAVEVTKRNTRKKR